MDRVKRATSEIVNPSGTSARKEDVIFLPQYAEERDWDTEAILRADRHRTWRNEQVTINDGIYKEWIRALLNWEWAYVMREWQKNELERQALFLSDATNTKVMACGPKHGKECSAKEATEFGGLIPKYTEIQRPKRPTAATPRAGKTKRRNCPKK